MDNTCGWLGHYNNNLQIEDLNIKIYTYKLLELFLLFLLSIILVSKGVYIFLSQNLFLFLLGVFLRLLILLCVLIHFLVLFSFAIRFFGLNLKLNFINISLNAKLVLHDLLENLLERVLVLDFKSSSLGSIIIQ